ncbi:uncharacterized protein [Typha angustifolia]|uniref:uncharacterized protein n=1 Tax=Typha angustifolia TaxID=59011 RepID=UPI003C2EBAD2
MGGRSVTRPAGLAGAGTSGKKHFVSGPAGKAKPTTILPFFTSSSSPLPSVSASSSASSSISHVFCPSEEGELGEGGIPNNGVGLSDHFVLFGPVPSEEEAEAALSALKQIFGLSHSKDELPSLGKDAVDKVPVSSKMCQRICSAEQESNKIEIGRQEVNHALDIDALNTFQSQGWDRIRNSFYLLQLNTSIQRMVISLSTDKAVWDAVMKNDAVQEIKQCFLPAVGSKTRMFADIVTRVMSWILENAMSKILELIDKITNLVNELFHSQEKGISWDTASDILSSSFMLSVLVFIVIIVKRIQGD